VTITDTQRAYEFMRQKIITTEMAPGSVIQEAVLMAKTGLGRTPIREALKILEAEHLVRVSPRRGMFVTAINNSDLAHIQEVRSALDPLCARLAASRTTPSELTQLRALLEEMRRAADGGDLQKMITADDGFHRLLAESTRNPILISKTRMLYNLSLRMWYYYLDRLTADDFAFVDLAEIVEALPVKDAARAERALASHINHFTAAIRRCL
jgi:DNA-binding GntR family transcriptional regulator